MIELDNEVGNGNTISKCQKSKNIVDLSVDVVVVRWAHTLAASGGNSNTPPHQVSLPSLDEARAAWITA